jgi:hypothetical protein
MTEIGYSLADILEEMFLISETRKDPSVQGYPGGIQRLL